jgi:hypothetical protein
MQPGELPGHHHEPCPGDAPGGFEVHAHRLADGHVILGLEIELPRLAPAPHLDIGRLVAALRHAGMQ